MTLKADRSERGKRMVHGNHRGFTLIEVIVVIAIIGILSAIAIPNMIGWRGERQLEGAAREFNSDMQLSRIAAIREAETVSVVFNVAGNSYQMFIDYNDDYTLNGADRQLRSESLPSGITISSCTFGGDHTQFDTRGKPNILGRLVFQNTAGNTRTVFLNKLGRLSVQ